MKLRVISSLLAAALLGGCASAPAPGRPAPGSRIRPHPAAHPPPRPPHPPARARSRATWLIDPDGPLPRDSRWRPVLAVARRFATAEERYEVGETPMVVRRAIVQTCTAAFGAELLSHPAVLPPGVSPRQVRRRLAGVQPLGRLTGSAVVLASVVPVSRTGQPGAFELRLVPRRESWRVAGMSIV